MYHGILRIALDLQVVRWEPPVFNIFMKNVCCHDMSKDQVASIELENYPTKILIKERCCTTVPKTYPLPCHLRLLPRQNVDQTDQ